MITHKIEKLIEEALSPKEERYLLNVQNFDRISNYNKIDQRTDWYFPNYRIRHSVAKGKDNWDTWSKISNSQAGLKEKKKIMIKPQNENDLHKKASFAIEVISKRPFINGKELYLEKVKVFKNGKYIKEFYTTETETPEDKDKIKYLQKLPEVKSIKNMGEKNLRQITKEMIR
jgi:hypothetical protein